jgi:hypothetical protein
MDAELSYWEAVEAGDPETVADAEERFGLRCRHDPVAEWPSDRLHELIEQRPDLLPELQRRRPREVEQR